MNTNGLLSTWDFVGTDFETTSTIIDSGFESVSNSIPTTGVDMGFVNLKVTEDTRVSLPSPVGGNDPADGETKVQDDVILSWNTVEGAASYIIYFSTDEALVTSGDSSIAVTNLAGTTFDPGQLGLYSNYYWRVDVVSDDANVVYEAGDTLSFKPTIPSELGRGHRIFLKRGLLSGAVVFPNDFGFAGAASGTNITWATWVDSRFNTVCTHNSWLNALTGPVGPTNTYYSRWCEDLTNLESGAGNGTISSAEEQYIGDNLVALQAGDEDNLTLTSVKNAVKAGFDRWKVAHPDTLVYTTQNGPSNEGGIDAFQKFAKPDMSYMFTYEFTNDGGDLNKMYKSLRDFREHGKKGIGVADYLEPIPYGMYFQAMNLQNRHVGQPEMCLAMFTPVAYGYKMINAFVYARNSVVAPDNNIRAELFEDGGDSVRRPMFDVAAENNRQIMLMGDTLVSLSSTGIYDVNDESSYISAWNSSSIPNITGISATDDVVISKFEPLHEVFDGPDYSGQIYFMVINAYTPVDGIPSSAARTITLTIGGGITALESINLTTGAVEVIPVTGGTVAVTLDGGRGKLFKFQTGAPFVGFYTGE